MVIEILINYNPLHKLHDVRANFRLPVLRSVGEILHAKDTVLKRVGSTPNKAETIEKTGGPDFSRTIYSTVTDFAKFLG